MDARCAQRWSAVAENCWGADERQLIQVPNGSGSVLTLSAPVLAADSKHSSDEA